MNFNKVITIPWLMIGVALLLEMLVYILPIETAQCLKEVRYANYEFFTSKGLFLVFLLLILFISYLNFPITKLIRWLLDPPCDDLQTTDCATTDYLSSMRGRFVYLILSVCKTSRCRLVMIWSHYLVAFLCGILTAINTFISLQLFGDCKPKSMDKAFARGTCIVEVVLNGWFFISMMCIFWQNEHTLFKNIWERIKMLITGNPTRTSNSSDYTAVPIDLPQDQECIPNSMDKTEIALYFSKNSHRGNHKEYCIIHTYATGVVNPAITINLSRQN